MSEPQAPARFRSFEECLPELERIVERKRSDWAFKASVMKDFDDVKSEILTHIWKKWHLYDQDRPLGGWAATILKNKWVNILRDIYGSTASPCLRCPANLGNGRCSAFGDIESLDCNLFKKWYGGKRHSHNVRLPVSIEDKMNEVAEYPESIVDLERAIGNMHIRMKQKLTASEWEIYYRLYVEHKEEEQTALELGFKTTEHGRQMGNKRVRHVKNLVEKKAQEILAEYGLETI